MEDNMITWLLVAVCSPHCIKNPYLVAKIIEVLFVLNPGIQARTEPLHDRIMAHSVSVQYLPSFLMKFYTGNQKGFFLIFILMYNLILNYYYFTKHTNADKLHFHVSINIS